MAMMKIVDKIGVVKKPPAKVEVKQPAKGVPVTPKLAKGGMAKKGKC